jgi:uncharacterized protein YabN with tetrapyrrole methylase and pyrophosphatase domain
MKTDNDYFVEKLQHELNNGNLLETAYKTQLLSAKVGFDFDSIEEAYQKCKEEFKEIDEAFKYRDKDKEHFIEEIGDGFFALINLARFAGISPTQLLYNTTKKYLKRVEYIENKLKQNGLNWQDSNKKELDKLWDEAKEKGL